MSIPKREGPRKAHYFDPHPAADSRPREVELDVAGRTLRLVTDAGVFSHGRLDAGTRVLLAESPGPPRRGELLDLGCGYGPIALWLAAGTPGARVWAVDVNERAVDLMRRNAESAGLGNVVAGPPEVVPPDLGFDAIYSNPPVRVGKEALHGLLLAWLPRLKPGGAAYLVVQQHLGSDSLARWLGDQGWPVSRLASKRSYRVLAIRRAG